MLDTIILYSAYLCICSLGLVLLYGLMALLNWLGNKFGVWLPIFIAAILALIGLGVAFYLLGDLR